MIVPVPVPDLVTARANVGAGVVDEKTASTLVAAFIVTLQVMPMHAPLQPRNVDPLAGVAVSDTTVP